jgi:membrane protein YdbS with pleckstrin-like domain
MKIIIPLLNSLVTSVMSAFPKDGFTLTRLFQEGESVPGSTTGILLMGILIVLIIVIPIVWRRRQWMR